MRDQSFVPQDYDLFGGLDVDKRSISVTFTNHQGFLRGDGRLRSKLVQASWSAIRQDAELREFFRSVCRTHPRNIAPRVAIVAVARKLSVRISVVLMQQRPYVVREKVQSAPLAQEETSPQGTTRRLAEPGEQDKDS